MNLLSGYALMWHWHGYGFEAWWIKLGFILVKFSFGMKVKGQGNPSSQGGWKTIIEWPMNDN